MAEQGITRTLAAYALSDAAALPAAVRVQACRAFLNHVACTVGAVYEPASVHAMAQADMFSGPRRATVLGRSTRVDALHAAWLNGLQSSIQTFDDTHLASVVHPTGPVASAALALLEHDDSLAVSGEEFLATLAFGIEIACRVGAVLTGPNSGLHLGVFTTGLAGAVGAAAACGRLLRLDVQRQTWALGIAAAQAAGLRVSHASMTGGLIPGQAARGGLEAALLAARGFDCSEAGLEARNGLFDVFAPGAKVDDAVAALGERFEIADLAFKPYPCGIVIHPAIDGCLALVQELAGEAIDRVRLRVHPLALQLTGTRHPRHGMDCKVSLFHWTAAALSRQRAGMDEQTDAAVHDSAIAALRDRIEAEPDAALARDEAFVEVRLVSGRTLAHHVPHARGSRERPLTDDELDAKFRSLVTPVLSDELGGELLTACRSLPVAGPDWVARLTRITRFTQLKPHT